MPKRSIEDLISDSYRQLQSRHCWATKLRGDARQYISALEALEDPPNMTAVSRILKDHFDFTVNPKSIRIHMRGECRCPR